MTHSHAHPSIHSGQAQEEKVTFGFWVYLMSDVVLFATLFATYAVLQGQTFGAPHISDVTSLPFVLWETVILLTSSFTIGLLVYFAKSKQNAYFFSALVATLVLGVTFLSMEVYEFYHLLADGHGPQASASLSAFFTLVGTHGVHVFFGIVWGTLLGIQAILWGFNSTVLRRLMSFSLFWHFLDVIWIFIFTFVYLFGAVL